MGNSLLVDYYIGVSYSWLAGWVSHFSSSSYSVIFLGLDTFEGYSYIINCEVFF